ncbi:MAG: hypothetical protein GY922_00005 [Proteobacteria bacterium]|nr:hypothetical protein [Pseudomonadota bacterium]
MAGRLHKLACLSEGATDLDGAKRESNGSFVAQNIAVMHLLSAHPGGADASALLRTIGELPTSV